MLLMLLKAIYSLLLPPASFVLMFAAFALWLFIRTRYRRAAALLAFFTILLWMSATPLVGSLLTRSLERQYVPPDRFTADSIVMLTGGATPDTPNLDHGLGHVQADTAGRLLTTARLQRLTGLPLLISGGQVFATTGNEAEISQVELLGLGIPRERIVLDRTSRNTHENAENSAAILQSKGWSRPLLVTSAVHMARAAAEFRLAGIDVLPFPTDYKVNIALKPTLLSFIPSSRGMDLTAAALKEYLGLLPLRFRI